jgi:hypothetical protein
MEEGKDGMENVEFRWKRWKSLSTKKFFASYNFPVA